MPIRAKTAVPAGGTGMSVPSPAPAFGNSTIIRGSATREDPWIILHTAYYADFNATTTTLTNLLLPSLPNSFIRMRYLALYYYSAMAGPVVYPMVNLTRSGTMTSHSVPLGEPMQITQTPVDFIVWDKCKGFEFGGCAGLLGNVVSTTPFSLRCDNYDPTDDYYVTVEFEWWCEGGD